MGNKQDRLAAHINNVTHPHWPYSAKYSTPISKLEAYDSEEYKNAVRHIEEYIERVNAQGRTELVVNIDDHMENGVLVAKLREIADRIESYAPEEVVDDNPYYDPNHPDDCMEDECLFCGVRDCPHNEPLHYHHDGCPACYSAQKSPSIHDSPSETSDVLENDEDKCKTE
jgi:hypothetical protein